MATTTNYGWTTPDDTSLVKDGAAAIRTLGSSVDTTTKALNPQTTTGALAYRSATSNVNTSLPLGTAGQVLTVNSGATAPEWAAAAGWNPNYQLLNAGGTALTGAATVTVSGISGKNALLLVFDGASSASASSNIFFRLNTDSGANYGYAGLQFVNSTAGSTFQLSNTGGIVAIMGNAAANTITGIVSINGTGTAGYKPYTVGSWGGFAAGTTNASYSFNGFYKGTSAVTSVSAFSDTGNFDAGTLYVYGA